jgi:hypothetical protein
MHASNKAASLEGWALLHIVCFGIGEERIHAQEKLEILAQREQDTADRLQWHRGSEGQKTGSEVKR